MAGGDRGWQGVAGGGREWQGVAGVEGGGRGW